MTCPAIVHKGSLFSASLPALVIFCPSDYSHSSWHKVVSHCGLICVSLISDFEHFFQLAICLLVRNVYLGLLPFWIGLFFWSSLYILDLNPLWDVQFTNIFSHYIGCRSDGCFRCCAKASYFNVIPFSPWRSSKNEDIDKFNLITYCIHASKKITWYPFNMYNFKVMYQFAK